MNRNSGSYWCVFQCPGTVLNGIRSQDRVNNVGKGLGGWGLGAVVYKWHSGVSRRDNFQIDGDLSKKWNSHF